MTQGNIRALRTVRDNLVEARRLAAANADADGVVAAQLKIATLDAAIADERALGQAEKDEEAMGRAIKKGNQGNIGDVSILSDAIKLAD
jgi:hypothetical protein